MELLRDFTQWVGRHRTLGTVIVLLLSSAVATTRFVASRSDGNLSNPVKRGPIIDAVYGIGTVTAIRSYSIKPGVTTTIQDLYVKEGDSVRKGQALAIVNETVYRAPFAGVVNYLPFKVGENVFTQLPVLVLTDLKDRYLVVSLEQQGALRVRAGQKAKLSFDSIRDRTYDGVVQSVYSYNGNFIARIDVASLSPEILPDMTADVAIVIREVPDALIVPVAAYENGFLWVKRGYRLPERQPVTLGVVDGTMAQITSGDILPGDKLMIHRKVNQ